MKSTKIKNMESFNYHNIFETKGMEYIAIIIFFILLIPFWIVLNRKTTKKRNIKKAIGMFTLENLRIPQGFFYGKNHTWVYLDKSGIASVGIDDFLLHATGEVAVNNIVKTGAFVKKGDLLTVIENNKKTLKIFSPISGEIKKLNINTELLNEDSNDNGWIMKIKPNKWIDETNKMFFSDDALNWFNLEMQKLKDFIAISNKRFLSEKSLLVLQDGGELIDHTLSELPDSVWNDFQDSFLKQP